MDSRRGEKRGREEAPFVKGYCRYLGFPFPDSPPEPSYLQSPEPVCHPKDVGDAENQEFWSPQPVLELGLESESESESDSEVAAAVRVGKKEDRGLLICNVKEEGFVSFSASGKPPVVHGPMSFARPSIRNIVRMERRKQVCGGVAFDPSNTNAAAFGRSVFLPPGGTMSRGEGRIQTGEPLPPDLVEVVVSITTCAGTLCSSRGRTVPASASASASPSASGPLSDSFPKLSRGSFPTPVRSVSGVIRATGTTSEVVFPRIAPGAPVVCVCSGRRRRAVSGDVSAPDAVCARPACGLPLWVDNVDPKALGDTTAMEDAFLERARRIGNKVMWSSVRDACSSLPPGTTIDVPTLKIPVYFYVPRTAVYFYSPSKSAEIVLARQRTRGKVSATAASPVASSPSRPSFE